jgi:hypothetical protein
MSLRAQGGMVHLVPSKEREIERRRNIGKSMIGIGGMSRGNINFLMKGNEMSLEKVAVVLLCLSVFYQVYGDVMRIARGLQFSFLSYF